MEAQEDPFSGTKGGGDDPFAGITSDSQDDPFTKLSGDPSRNDPFNTVNSDTQDEIFGGSTDPADPDPFQTEGTCFLNIV